MRRLSFVLLAFLLLLPAAAFARDVQAGDGSLQVSNAWVRLIVVKGDGLVYGHIDSGTLILVGYDAADTRSWQVSGAPAKVVGGLVRYSGSDLRFLFPNGHYVLRLEGDGIDFNAVGKGTVTAFGIGSEDDGSLAVNSGKAQQLGFLATTATFGTRKDQGAGAAVGAVKAATR
jgi:hypothetical protein